MRKRTWLMAIMVVFVIALFMFVGCGNTQKTNSRATGSPAMTNEPNVSDVPEMTKAPEGDSLPEDAPAATEVPTPTEAPAATETPKAPEESVPTEVPEPTLTPEPTATPVPHEHSFTNYVYDSNATRKADGTETAECDIPGCTETDSRIAEGTRLEPEWTECRKEMWVKEEADESLCYKSCWGFDIFRRLVAKEKVILTGTADTFMCRIELDGQVAYTFLDSLTDMVQIATPTPNPTPTPTPAPTPTPRPVRTYTFTDTNYRIYANGKSMRVYDEPAKDGEKIDSLTKTYLTVTGICNETGFYRIEYNGKTGYLDSELPSLYRTAEDFPYEMYKLYELSDDMFCYYYRGSEHMKMLDKMDELVSEAIRILDERGKEMVEKGICSDYLSWPGDMKLGTEDKYWDVFCTAIKLNILE